MTFLQWLVLPVVLIGILGSGTCSFSEKKEPGDYKAYQGPTSGDKFIDCTLKCKDVRKQCLDRSNPDGKNDAVAGNVCKAEEDRCLKGPECK